VVAPYRPAAHGVHGGPDPAMLKVPAPHRVTVALGDPAGHTYPAAQDPLHPVYVVHSPERQQRWRPSEGDVIHGM
jgi:hypothetical protein